jgi:hypothetical protein
LKIPILLLFSLFFSCAHKKKVPQFYPQFEAKALPSINHGHSPLLVSIDDRRPKSASPSEEKVIGHLKKSLKNIYGDNIKWVKFDNGVPERGHVEILVKKMKASFKSPYWMAKSAVSLKFVDRRIPKKEIVQEKKFQGTFKKLNIPWKNTQYDVLKKSWEKISGDILRSFNNFFKVPPS